jgi:RNA polymerase sigma factor (sigma-70 family)
VEVPVSYTDWFEVMEAMDRGSPAAVSRVAAVVTGFLARYRAYDIRDAWDDVCQEVLIQLIRSHRRKSIRSSKAFIKYVGLVTRSKLIDYVERRRRTGCTDDWRDLGSVEAAVQSANAKGISFDAELQIDLRRALKELPARSRCVLEALYLERRTYVEAADHLGMKLGTLKRIQTQGLRELRRMMGFEPIAGASTGGPREATSVV